MLNKKKTAIIMALLALVLTGCSKADTIDRNSGHYKNQIQNRNMETENFSGAEDVEAAELKTIAEASTPILDKSPDRVHNIRLACESLKNITIESGQEFSFNNVVGERNAERGYKEAAAILYDERVYEYGGGVCQISSTIYQAVKNSGLKVTERNPHNKKVDYAEEGMDACVEYGRLDFKFQNNSDKPIILKTSTDGEYVYVSIEINS